MGKKNSLQNLLAFVAHVRLSSLLVCAAAIHLLLTITLNVIGRYNLLPYTFDENGIGVSFALDSADYRNTIAGLAEILKGEGFLAWIKDPSPLHVKLYSVPAILLAPLFGYTTLSVEPLNLAYYLLILVSVFLLGREMFDRRVGILSAALVAVWPSLLLHTTQLLRDPLFIVAVLTLLLVCVILLKRELSLRQGIALALSGGAAANIVWLVRSQMWEVITAVAALNLCLLLLALAVRSRRRRLFYNLAGSLLLFLIVLGLPQLGRRLNLYSYPPNQVVVKVQPEGQKQVAYGWNLPPGSSLPARITFLRSGFVNSYPQAGSNIDFDVEFKSVADIVLYLPRAAEIGFFAPFPGMWLVRGPQTGLAGRLLSGIETLLIYGLYVLAGVCLWRSRRQASVWLLFAAASIAMTALGLVVANIASLYRMRYAFWILIIVLGAKGALSLFAKQCEPEACAGGAVEV